VLEGMLPTFDCWEAGGLALAELFGFDGAAPDLMLLTGSECLDLMEGGAIWFSGM